MYLLSQIDFLFSMFLIPDRAEGVASNPIMVPTLHQHILLLAHAENSGAGEDHPRLALPPRQSTPQIAVGQGDISWPQVLGQV